MGVRESRPGQLAQLRARVERLTRAGFRAELSQRLGAEAMKLVADEFRQERDPYGKAWQKLAPKTRKAGKRDAAKILRLTGRMAASAAAIPSSNGFEFTMAWPAPVHQNGAPSVGIPQRMLVPTRAAGGLGPIWATALNREAGRVVRSALGRG